MRAQGVVGIGRDRVGDFLEKRNVVVRVAVEITVFEVTQAFAHRREPRFGAHDLAFAIARRARRAAGQIAVRHIVDRFDLARDQRFNAEPAARAGAAVVVPDGEFSGVRLVQEIRRLGSESGGLAAMAAASLAFGRPDAARDVARVVLDAAAGSSR